MDTPVVIELDSRKKSLIKKALFVGATLLGLALTVGLLRKNRDNNDDYYAFEPSSDTATPVDYPVTN